MAHDTKKSGVKMGYRVPKAYGIMPVISNGDAFFLDIGSVTFLNEEVVFSGTKGYFSLLQQCKSDGLVSLLGGRLSISPQLIRQLKQWQDSFGFSATIFFVLVGQLLNEKHETIASKAEFDSCIRHCADKIIKADFPYPYQQAQALK